MKFADRSYSMRQVFPLVILITLCLYCEKTLSISLKPDELATVVGKAFSYKLPADLAIHSGYTYKLHRYGGEDLPSWLTFDSTKNILLGIPTHHDKGSHAIQLDIISDETNKTVEAINFLTIDVVQHDKDLKHYNILRPTPLAQQSSSNVSQSPLDCPNNLPVVVATMVFDLSARKLSGAKRVELMKNVSKWSDVDIEMLRFLPGKGEKTAFNLKDVILLTAGPGWIKDVQERGVCVSWKIGCGVNIAGNSFVIQLKSASETGAFKTHLGSPVVAWHVTHGVMKHRQVVRVRRDAHASTPRPTSAFVTPTSVPTETAPGVMRTPTIAPSPTALPMTLTMSSASPSIAPGPQPTPANTPPTLDNPIGSLTTEVDVYFVYLIPPNTFSDKEDGLTPKLKLEMFDPDGRILPSDLWLKLDPSKQTLEGKPGISDIGKVKILLTVTDSGGLKEVDKVEISVVGKNEPPQLINHIDLIKLYVGQPIKFPVPYDTFYDLEDGDTNNLTLEMSNIDGQPLSPDSWVYFDARTRTIFALPRREQIGKPEFLMVATDSGKKKARDAFEFHVLEVDTQFNHLFGLVLDFPYSTFKGSVILRVELCYSLGNYFKGYFNTSTKDLRVQNYNESLRFEWKFANIANDLPQVLLYKEKYEIGDTKKPVEPFGELMANSCPKQESCPVEQVYVRIFGTAVTTPDPNVLGRAQDRGSGTWWQYTIIPAFVVAALILVIGLIVIICIRCRRRSKLKKNDKIVFLYRKKPAVFREEYPAKEVYGNQPLITPSEKPPLPPPSYPRSSTPTDDPSVTLLSDCSLSYQPPSFDSSHEQTANARLPVPSYRLPPPYVAP